MTSTSTYQSPFSPIQGTRLEVPTIQLVFDVDIEEEELPSFRGAINTKIPRSLIAYHNHFNDTQTDNSYPTIQYRRFNGKAGIMYMGEGVQGFDPLMQHQNWELHLHRYNRKVRPSIYDYIPEQFPIFVDEDQLFSYRVKRWIPFKGTPKEVERHLKREYRYLSDLITKLENKLRSNILYFASSMGMVWKRGEADVVVRIVQIERERSVQALDNPAQLGYDILFDCNACLPSHIGLGKRVAHNMGVLEAK